LFDQAHILEYVIYDIGIQERSETLDQGKTSFRLNSLIRFSNCIKQPQQRKRECLRC